MEVSMRVFRKMIVLFLAAIVIFSINTALNNGSDNAVQASVEDSNGDGIPDSKQALYTVEFKLSDPSLGKFEDFGVIKFVVAGKEGTQGQAIKISEAISIKKADDMSDAKFDVPKIYPVTAFKDEWFDGSKNYSKNDIISKDFEIKRNTVFVAKAEPLETVMEFVGFTGSYVLSVGPKIGETIGEAIIRDTNINPNKIEDAVAVFKGIRTNKTVSTDSNIPEISTNMTRPRFKISGWMINGVTYNNSTVLKYKVTGPVKLIAIYSAGTEI